MNYDVILIHPPAIYDFRKRPIFPSTLATVDRIQYTKVPIGMLSIADYLDRHDYKIVIDNLADRMVNSTDFDAEEHIKNTSARIYAIDLHFHHHAQGAIEVARLCKQLHPDSLVILGGLTATYHHEEIIRKYEFIDAVIRGEAERPFLKFLRALEKNGKLTATPNLTCRTDGGEVSITPLMPPSDNLDEFEFTRFDLLEPRTSIFPQDKPPHGSLVVCRGCTYNCAICGGSAYAYKTYLGMCKPAFRSPAKIVEDMRKLNEQGIRFIGLYQDPRMGGEKYWKELVNSIRRANLDIESLNMDLLAPADEEFIREVATIGKQVIFYICPDTGACDVRKSLGRCYSNENLLNTIRICHRYHIPVTVFLSFGLAGETDENIKETWELWGELCKLDNAAINKGGFGSFGNYILKQGPILGPIMLDPCSLSTDFPEKYGYKKIFSNLEEYIQARFAPSWHQWLNYETEQLDKEALIELTLESIENFIRQREKHGVYNKNNAAADYFLVRADRIAVAEVNRIMNLPDDAERESRLRCLAEAIESPISSSPSVCDPYGYRGMIEKILDC